VPIPDAPAGPDATAAVAALFFQVHNEFRSELDWLDDAAVNWVPTSGANSIATIITHVIGSEAETIRSVAGVASERNRAAEFGGDGLTKRDVLGLLDVADRLLSELVGASHPSG
jgi:hypothetical protein